MNLRHGAADAPAGAHFSQWRMNWRWMSVSFVISVVQNYQNTMTLSRPKILAPSGIGIRPLNSVVLPDTRRRDFRVEPDAFSRAKVS